MKEIKYYCDMCGKEIEESQKSKYYIPIRINVGKHGTCSREIRIVNRDGSCMEFCEDCKGTIALLFGGKSNE